MSMKGKGIRQRGYSVVEERDVTIAKALMFVVKRAIQKEEVEEGEDGEYLVADPEGWISLADVIVHSRISALGATLEDVQRVVVTATKSRFDLRQVSGAGHEGKAEEPSSWEISRITSKENVTSPIPVGDKLTPDSPDIPEFAVYETSYQRYPLILALGAITRAPGGSEYRTFVPVTVDDEGNESRQNPGPGEAAEVSVWVHLRTALLAEPSITWYSSDSGTVITTDDVPKGLWKKAVARRPDIGILFEDGEIRKEVPINLRGKGAKGKARKGKGVGLKKEEDSGDDSGSASEE
jgi:2'-phosphotransferase